MSNYIMLADSLLLSHGE